MEEFITIATFHVPTSAYLLKAQLEAEGITVFLRDEHVNNLIPMGPFGGIKIQVPLNQSVQAFSIYHDSQSESETMEI